MAISLSDFERFPKIDLHRHLDGSVPKEVVRRLALKDGLKEYRTRGGLIVPVTDEAAFDKFYQINDVADFGELLSRFDFVLNVMQTFDNIQQVFYEATCALAAENIWHVEWTIAPAYHTRGGLKYFQVLDAAGVGMRWAFEDFGVSSKLVVAIQREAIDEVKPEDIRDPLGLKLVKTALSFGPRGLDFIAALGLVCDEAKYPPEIYRDAFAETFGTDLARTIHAGEFGTVDDNVRRSILDLHTNGIGHGVNVGRNPELINLLYEKNVRLEMNPISNLQTHAISSVGELELDVLKMGRIKVSINSDDPVLFRKSLAENFKLVFDYYGWGESELNEFTYNALSSAFLSPAEYRSLLKRLEKRGFRSPVSL